MSRDPLKFSDSNFRAEVLEAKGPVLVDFWAGWCGPCIALAPTIHELAEASDEPVKVGKLDVDANPKTAMSYGIRSIPTVLVFVDGEVVEQLVGVHPVETYQAALQKALDESTTASEA